MTAVADVVFLAGRVILGAYFIYSAWYHFRKTAMFAQYAASKGTPAPKAAVLGTGALLLLGGLSVLTGLYPKVGLALLVLFFLGVTPRMHAYWKLQDPMQRMGEQVNFTKNLALLGACLALMGVPEPWVFGLGFGL